MECTYQSENSSNEISSADPVLYMALRASSTSSSVARGSTDLRSDLSSSRSMAPDLSASNFSKMCLTFDRMRSSDFRYHLENSSNEIYGWGEMDGDRGVRKGKG